MEEAGNRTLRAKYLDWCSARIAERFLDLSPEEIYELAFPHVGAGAEAGGVSGRLGRGGGGGGAGSGGGAGGGGAGGGGAEDPAGIPGPGDESYRGLVQRVTESLLERMPLPTFEQWSAAYAEAPGRFDAELLGFWREVEADGGE